MKITEEQRLLNKDKIIDTAGHLFRERGFDGVGISDIMKEAGFTHGGFYNHFKSKDELAAAAIDMAFAALEKETRGKEFDSIIKRYLSHEHRDDLSQACPASALGGETARQSEMVKETFSEGIETWISMIDEAIPEDSSLSNSERRKTIIGYFAKLVGASILARSCPSNSKLGDEILNACKLSMIKEIKANLK